MQSYNALSIRQCSHSQDRLQTFPWSRIMSSTLRHYSVSFSSRKLFIINHCNWDGREVSVLMLTRSRSGVDWGSWPDLDCFKQFTDQIRLSIIPQQRQYRYTSFRMLDIRLKDDQSIQLSEMLLKGLAWAPVLGKTLKTKLVTFLQTGEGL